ncbi:uncharacterized protein LOC130047335 [Ostrea edulis]|uniref:uncharacterized protein LOC130047335 n=1 Tax=Ostrea edulis TaxID=37623 RepID=UPI0024AF2930|nr:uncharacterized protein LOC130047335 [Ostrea edulis]
MTREITSTEAEETARNGNMKDLYNATKKLPGKYSKPERPVKSKDGKTLKGEEQQCNRWKEYFERLLNRPAPPNLRDIPPAEKHLPIDSNTHQTGNLLGKKAVEERQSSRPRQYSRYDLALLSHTRQQKQEKTNNLASTSAQVGLNLNKGKIKILKVNTISSEPIKLEDETLEEVESFTYLGIVIDKLGGTGVDVRAGIGKARAAFLQLKNMEFQRADSADQDQANVKSVLLYSAEAWRTTVATVKKVQNFMNSCLRRMPQICWLKTISNKDLWQRTNQLPAEDEILG